MAAKPTAVIMAAGRGTRMRSSVSKVLHPVCGRPMVEWVIEAARAAGAEQVVCVVRPGDGVGDALPEGVDVVEQTEGEGTGSAVLAAKDTLTGDGPVLVLSGDHPLVSGEALADLLETHARTHAAATLLATVADDPAGYGRIVRAPDGTVDRIVETKNVDGIPERELMIREINVGSYAFDPKELFAALEHVQEAGGERYLTAAIPAIRAAGGRIEVCPTGDALGALGINDRAALLELERLAQARIIDALALAGVTFSAPETVSIDAGVKVGKDTLLEPGVVLRGNTTIGENCAIGPHTTIIDCTIADEVNAPHCYFTGAEVESGATLGPFSYLRPGASIGEGAKIGAFVEVKNSRIGARAKVPHLSYIGDADVGEEANVAAGNITANYDGFRKHRTKIGKRAKTGVDTAFVAPVAIGDDAYTGAGSVITDDVPDGALGISRPKQENVEGYAEKVDKEKGS